MIPGSKIGKYEIQQELAQGDRSTVYKGWDPAIGRSVAIKAIDRALYQRGDFESAMSRFRREAQAIGRLVHPRIVQIYDYIENEQGGYIVMELVNGKALAQHLALGDTYDVNEVGRIILQILDGIGYAHAEGVVHRNIKPSNILINNDGRLKINDFSLAHVDSSTLTQVGELLGTPHYMAPEQFMDVRIDGRADLFAIGVIAYELLTGQRPFKGNLAKFMQQMMNERPADPSLLNPRLNKDIDAVLHKALAKRREERYQTAREFADAFRQAIDSTQQPAAAQPGGTDAKAADTKDAVAQPTSTMATSAKAEKSSAAAPRPAAIQPSASVHLEATSELNADDTIKFDARAKRACVLLVDDDERELAALKAALQQSFHVFSTTDARKALEFLSHHQMHVIISDQRMPDMTGVELLRQSRAVSPHSVRILLSGYAELAAIVGSINDGEVYRFISKPWDDHVLQSIVAEAATIGLELADSGEAEAELHGRALAGVLVVGDDEETYRVTRELLGSVCPVVHAADAGAALRILGQQEIAVVLADVGSGGGQLVAMLKIMEQEHPRVLTIVTAGEAESAQAIELLNQTQVFRLLGKPMKVALLKRYVHAALDHYRAQRRKSDVPPVQETEAHGRATGILNGLKVWRWFGGK